MGEHGLIRTCEHTGTVVTNMSAVAYGRGHASGAVSNPLLALFYKLGLLMMERLRGNRVQ